MKFYEKIGMEIAENYPELEVADWENDEIPNCILIQGTWETANGEFAIDYEWLTDEKRILWLRISEITENDEVEIFESEDLSEFKAHYPQCHGELLTFPEEAKR